MVRRAIVAAGATLLFLTSVRATQADSHGTAATLIVSADTEGQVGPCVSCSDFSGFGGLARRATLVAKLRTDDPSLLLVDAGNSLFGEESVASRGAVVAAALEALRYDAINVGYRDFHYGKDATLALLRKLEASAISANLVDAATGVALLRPYVVRTSGAERVAFVGLTEDPPARKFLRTLREQLAGIDVAPAVDALAAVLPGIRKESDRVVLLYYGSLQSLAPVRARFGGDLDAIVVGAARPDALPVDHDGLIATEAHGKFLARATLADRSATPRVDVTQMPIEPKLAADPAMEKLLATFSVESATPAVVPVTPPQSKPAPPTLAPLTPAPSIPSPRESVEPTPPTQARQPKGLAGVGLTAEQVNAAIDRGGRFLWKYVKEKDLGASGKLGCRHEHGLACLALIHAGMRAKLPDFDAALRSYLAQETPWMANGESSRTYEAAIHCMVIDACDDLDLSLPLRRAARWLVETQNPSGSWTYSGEVADAAAADGAAPAVGLEVRGGVALDDDAPGSEWKRLGGWREEEAGDASNTQYALLGLDAAERGGLKMPKETWQRASAYALARAGEDGGFTYHDGGDLYGSMTCAGICGLALCRNHGAARDPKAEAAIGGGLEWLQKRFMVNDHPTDSSTWNEWLHYYLYSVERVGRTLDSEFIGDHEWYPLGARFLVDTQRSDGSWVGRNAEGDPRLATSFALLFLTRATPAPHVAKPHGGEGRLATSVTVPPIRLFVILDCSGSMLDEVEGRSKFALAREAVAQLVGELPEGSELGLRVYGHRLRGNEPGANEDVELLFPLQPVDPREVRRALDGLRARGKTPLAKSLRDTRAELAREKGDRPVTVLLFTDGGEDTRPMQDPVAAAADLATLKGVELRIVGFDIHTPDWSEQLQRMTAAAKGSYVAALAGGSLPGALRRAVFGSEQGIAAIEYELRDAHEQSLGRGHIGETKTLPEGRYHILCRLPPREEPFEARFWINGGRTTPIVLHLQSAGR